MATVIGVHGIGQQYKGENLLRQVWRPALRDGLSRVERSLADGVDVACAFYGDLFRPTGGKATGDPPYEAADVDEPFEQELLDAWAAEAARVEGGDPDAPAKGRRVPRTIQGMLDVLSGSKFFVGLLERAVIADLKQVRSYFKDPGIRKQVQAQGSGVLS